MGTRVKVDNPPEEPYNKWVLTTTLWPKTCAISGRPIPMYTKAYLNKTAWNAETWILAEEFIFAQIKGEME